MKKKVFMLLLLVCFILSCKGGRPSNSSSSEVASLSEALPSSPQISPSPQVSSSQGIDAPPDQGILPGYRGYWERTGRINIFDLIEFYPEQLPYLRNEIFARYGRPFVNKIYQDYFRAKNWYQERSDFSESWLSQADRDNADFINSVEQSIRSIDEIAAQVLRNIEYTGNSAVLTFTSRQELMWSDKEVDFGPYGLSSYGEQRLSWLAMGDWVLAYDNNMYEGYDVAAYKLNHNTKRITASVSRNNVDSETLEKLIRAQR